MALPFAGSAVAFAAGVIALSLLLLLGNRILTEEVLVDAERRGEAEAALADAP